MKIYGVRTIDEYKKVQRDKINDWINANFIKGSVTWEMVGASKIKVIDKAGDSMIISLDDIN